MNEKSIQIVVLGAGYAGMMAALRLSGKTKRLGTSITLINDNNEFIQRPRLHHVSTGQKVPTKAISEMIRGTRVTFRQGWVTALNPELRRVTIQTVNGEDELAYDYLVYALGSRVDRQRVPGADRFAYALDPAGVRSAEDLQRRLETLYNGKKPDRKAKVVVVGGGPTGIEGATEIKGTFPNLDVSLVTASRFGSFKGDRVEAHFRDAFNKQGIHIIENQPIAAAEDGYLVTPEGGEIAFDLLLWAGGFRASPLARQSGLTVNQMDQMMVRPTLQSVSNPDIYAVGDAAQTLEEPGVPLRMGLLPALTMGAQAADNLTARIEGKEQKPLSFAYYGQGIALGPHDAVGYNGFPTEKVVGPIFRGRLGVVIRNFFVWLLFFILEVERRFPGFYFWLGKGRYRAQNSSQRQSSWTRRLLSNFR